MDHYKKENTKKNIFHYIKNIMCFVLILLLLKALLNIIEITNRDVEERYLVLQCLICIGVGAVIGVLLSDFISTRAVPRIWSITMVVFLGINTGVLLAGSITRRFLYLLVYLNDIIYYLSGIEGSYTVYIFVFCMQFVEGLLMGIIVYNKIKQKMRYRIMGR